MRETYTHRNTERHTHREKQRHTHSQGDPRQKAKREYNHPKDVCMALIYVLIAKTKYDPQGFKLSKIHKRPRW